MQPFLAYLKVQNSYKHNTIRITENAKSTNLSRNYSYKRSSGFWEINLGKEDDQAVKVLDMIPIRKVSNLKEVFMEQAIPIERTKNEENSSVDVSATLNSM